MAAGARRALAAVARMDDGDGGVLVEAQQLTEPQLQSGCDARRERERRAGLAALDLAEHRGADAAAFGEVAQRQPLGLAQRADAGPDRGGVRGVLPG